MGPCSICPLPPPSFCNIPLSCWSPLVFVLLSPLLAYLVWNTIYSYNYRSISSTIYHTVHRFLFTFGTAAGESCETIGGGNSATSDLRFVPASGTGGYSSVSLCMDAVSEVSSRKAPN